MRVALYIGSRLAAAVITVFGVCVLVFLSMQLVPGGYETVILGPFATPEQREALRVANGLDQPLVVQFFVWLSNCLQGDLGASMITQTPVVRELAARLPATLQLALMTIILAVAVGLPLGILSAVGKQTGALARLTRLAGAVSASLPDFVLGTIAIYALSMMGIGTAIGSYVPFLVNPQQNLASLWVPALVLAAFGVALVLRTTRDAVLNVTSQPYVLAAVARGETPFEIVRRHILRNIAIPVVTVVTTFVGYLLGGQVVIESLFSIPGVGLYIVNAISYRDYAVVQACVLVTAVIFVALNFFTDLSYFLFDPRYAEGNRQ
jgi:peptide/nickel transport system permease protein